MLLTRARGSAYVSMASGVATATQSATSSVPNGTEEERSGPPKPQLEGEAKIRRFLRGYVASQLKKKGYGELAAIVERETTRLMPSTLDEDEVADVLTRMADQLNEERAQQFESMCVQMNLSQTNAKRKFNKVMVNLFQKDITWGNIITLVTFTGHIATYCARHNMDEQSIEVLNDADMYLHERLLPWILEQGGWTEFRRHILGDFGSLAKAALTGMAVMTLYGLKKLLPS